MRAFFHHIPSTEARAACISLGVGIAILIIKFIAYFLTQSTAIFSDAVESIANVLASGVALYALSVAHRPADEEHPWGHGKIEFLSAWFEGSMILLAGVFIVFRTVDALIARKLVQDQTLDYGLILMVLSMVVNGGVGLMLIRTGRRQKSLALQADGRHLMSDVVTSAGVLVALGIVKVTGWTLVDPITAMLMAAYIIWMGAALLRRAAAGLMDEQDVANTRRANEILASHTGPGGREPRLCGFHKLRHRHAGRYLWIDFHVTIPQDTPIKAAHAIASAIEFEMEQVFGLSDATAHVEECTDADCPRCRLRESSSASGQA